MNTTTYRPHYHRPPNTFIRYEVRPFNGGKKRWAIYKDKSGNVKEDVAQVIWDKNEWNF